MADEPPSDSPEVSIVRLAFELGELHALLASVAEASRARTAELRQMNQRFRERLGWDDQDDIHA